MSERGFAAEQVSHAYSAAPVLADVAFALRPGRVAGLVGENGSGKSTLLKVMTGALRPLRGRLTLDGDAIAFGAPSDAGAAGVAVVHQDYHLFADLSVADNVLGVPHGLPHRGVLRRVDRAAVRDRVETLLAELGIPLSAGRLVRTLDAAERKFVEIARAMLARPRYLILDEPTASLEARAAERVLELVDRLRGQDVGVALVSHRLDEIVRIADEVTVLRDGRVVDVAPRGRVTERGLAEAVGGPNALRTIGRRARPAAVGGKAPPPAPAPALALRGVRARPGAPRFDLAVGRGEIVGLTGVLGAGAAHVVNMAGGAVPLDGTAEVDGAAVRLAGPADAVRARIGYVPEDRKRAGIVPEQSVAENIALASLDRHGRRGRLDRRAMADDARRFQRELGIRAPSIHAPLRTLSGGNQQKVLLARRLASGARVLTIDEPTHGVDVGGKTQIHELLRQFAADGGAVLVASTDVGEILDLCERVGVLRDGALVALRDAADLTRTDLTILGMQEAT